MTTEKIKIIIVEPSKQPKVAEIENTLKAMQAIVGGHIEVISPFGNDNVLVCNEEGRLQNLPFNRFLFDRGTGVPTWISGTFFICGTSEDEMCSVPDCMIDEYISRFTLPNAWEYKRRG